MKDLTVYRTEAQVAVMTGNKADATRTLEELDLISRKLEVGVFLRTFRKSAEQSDAGSGTGTRWRRCGTRSSPATGRPRGPS